MKFVIQSIPHTQKKLRGIREPDTFSGGNANNLWAFIFQYQIYLRAYKGEFIKDTEKNFLPFHTWGE